MLLYNNVAKLRHFRGRPAPENGLSARSDHPDIEVADLLAQGVAVDPQEVGGADLVAAGGRKGRGKQGIFDLSQEAMVEAGRRQRVVDPGEVAQEVALDRTGEVLFGVRLLAGSCHLRLVQLGL